MSRVNDMRYIVEISLLRVHGEFHFGGGDDFLLVWGWEMTSQMSAASVKQARSLRNVLRYS